MSDHWVKLFGEAAESAMVREVVESIAEVLEDMGIEVEWEETEDECKLTFAHKESREELI